MHVGEEARPDDRHVQCSFGHRQSLAFQIYRLRLYGHHQNRVWRHGRGERSFVFSKILPQP